MPLKYNRETSVDRDIKTQNKSEYTFYSENTLEQQSQNEKFNFSADMGLAETQSYTLVNDIVLTSIQYTVWHNLSGGSSETIHIYIDNTLIIHSHLSTSTEAQQDSQNIVIPNWKLKKGQTISAVTANAGAGLGGGSVAFIGYNLV